MTDKPSLRELHDQWAATIPDDDLTSPLHGDQDTTPTWPHRMWSGSATVTFTAPPGGEPELDPTDIVGWIA